MSCNICKGERNGYGVIDKKNWITSEKMGKYQVSGKFLKEGSIICDLCIKEKLVDVNNRKILQINPEEKKKTKSEYMTECDICFKSYRKCFDKSCFQADHCASDYINGRIHSGYGSIMDDDTYILQVNKTELRNYNNLVVNKNKYIICDYCITYWLYKGFIIRTNSGFGRNSTFYYKSYLLRSKMYAKEKEIKQTSNNRVLTKLKKKYPDYTN